MYLKAVSKNKIIKLDPTDSMWNDKKIYNENAIKQLLSWNTKEGNFILEGGRDSYNNLIKCEESNKDNKKSVLKKTYFNGYNLWNGYEKIKKIEIENEDIPKYMPGFSFINESCNPCSPLDNSYNCPFRLNTKGNNKVSEIWNLLWNI